MMTMTTTTPIFKDRCQLPMSTHWIALMAKSWLSLERWTSNILCFVIHKCHSRSQHCYLCALFTYKSPSQPCRVQVVALSINFVTCLQPQASITSKLKLEARSLNMEILQLVVDNPIQNQNFMQITKPCFMRYLIWSRWKRNNQNIAMNIQLIRIVVKLAQNSPCSLGLMLNEPWIVHL